MTKPAPPLTEAETMDVLRLLNSGIAMLRVAQQTNATEWQVRMILKDMEPKPVVIWKKRVASTIRSSKWD